MFMQNKLEDLLAVFWRLEKHQQTFERRQRSDVWPPSQSYRHVPFKKVLSLNATHFGV